MLGSHAKENPTPSDYRTLLLGTAHHQEGQPAIDVKERSCVPLLSALAYLEG